MAPWAGDSGNLTDTRTAWAEYRATSLGALQMSHAEFLAGFVGVIHWGAAAQESVSMCVCMSP